MLHKRNNSIITLALLLALVGVSKPAKAFLLAQVDAVKTTFTAPEQLPNNAKVQISAANSTSSVNQSLADGFATKYPQAKVNINAQSSNDAIKAVSTGKTDLAAIGRALTAEEKSKGLVSVPISREKIAIVISKNNPYEGNLTISQFAQIFRGEITDWSEIGGNPGKIQLVDLPETNDTRQAFPNYPVFQEGKFATGSNAIKTAKDSTDEMIAKLGANGIGYAVADDVLKRDDVKVVTMHSTQPDDQRYPFSQPFTLVYQGTPSKATEAFLGFATTENGQKAIAGRVGSLSAVSAAAIASNLAKPSPETNSSTSDTQAKTSVGGKDKVAPAPDAKDAKASVGGKDKVAAVPDAKDAKASVDGTGKTSVAQADSPKTSDSNLKVGGSGEVNPSVEGSGEPNQGLEKTGEVNPDIKGSGELNPALQNSGEQNPNVQGSGDINPNVQDSGEANPDAVENGASNSNPDTVEKTTTTNENQDKAIATKKNNWWWWIPLVLGVPLLGLAALKLLGGKKGDQEPAIGDISGPDNPQGGIDGGFDPDVDNLSTRGANVASDIEKTGVSSAGNASKLGGAAIATGGAAAATQFLGRRSNVEENIDADQDQIELENIAAQPDTDIDEPIVEIPSNPVNEFTGQETELQGTGQETELQGTGQETELQGTGQETELQGTGQETRLQTDDFENLDDPDNPTPGLLDNISQAGGAAMAGGAAVIGGGAAAASGFLGNRNDSDEENPRTSELDSDTETNTSSANLDKNSFSSSTFSPETEGSNEFGGDYVLAEDNATEVDSDFVDSDFGTDKISDVDDGDTVVDETNWVDDTTTINDSVTSFQTTEIELPDSPNSPNNLGNQDTILDEASGLVDGATQGGSTAIAGGAAGIGGAAAAASGFFSNRSSEQITEVDELDSNFGADKISDVDDRDTVVDETNWVDDTEVDDTTTINDSVTSFQTTEIELPDSPNNPNNLGNQDTILDKASGLVDGATQGGSAAIAGGAAGIGGAAAAASGFFSNRSSEQITEVDSDFNSDFDSGSDISEIDDENLSLGKETNKEVEDNLDLDSIANSADLSLDDITFDDTDGDAVNASLDEITFDEADDNSIDDLINSIDTRVNSRQEISLDGIDFDSESDLESNSSADLLSNKTAEIIDLSDNFDNQADQSDDMNNISTWLDSLDTPEEGTEDISTWLDSLGKGDSNDVQQNIPNKKVMKSQGEGEDISFQFLEDLLDRDNNPDQDNNKR